MSPALADTPLADATAPGSADGRQAQAVLRSAITAACEQACGAIAPAWPLDRAIAVNPHWQRIHRPAREVAARMALLGGMRVFPPRRRQREAWDSGRITPADLDAALAQLPEAAAAGLTPPRCVHALSVEAPVDTLPLLMDVLDDDPRRHTRLSWREAITHQVSQTCAAYFDRHQADWQPAREEGLYAFWRDTLLHDHGIGVLMGLPRLQQGLRALPATREAAELWVMQRLALPQAVWPEYLEAVLLTVNGWASWCAYLGWQARLEGRTDPHLRDLLAIRLAWGAILLECKGTAAAQASFPALQGAWLQAPQRLAEATQALLVDEVWQRALEIGWQRGLARGLMGSGAEAAAGTVAQRPKAQAVFCIDVRSEPLRRALETVDPAVQTRGFAGFFGLPAAYTPLGTAARRPQLPGLLAPAVEIEDRVQPGTDGAPVDTPEARGEAPSIDLTELAALARRQRLALSGAWHAATRWPGAAFSFVESLGVGYAGALAGWLRPRAQPRQRDDLHGLPTRYRALCRPVLSGLHPAEGAALAAKVLRAMGMVQGLAPVVLLVGHGSQSANNAHAAALDCGACCGQTGEVNARSLARLLNDAAVRSELQAREGLMLPTDTVFVAALHNTTTDEIELHDLDLLPPAGRAACTALQPALQQAGHRVRAERAAALGLDAGLRPEALLAQVQRRASDGAQTRPEWGLAGNAGFVIAPRSRTQGLRLDGRSFLHDYDHAQDADGSVLELLMTAPMLVTHWINWQYHASTCEPARLGSGNKVLHNVVGGHIGVFEGNGGDLRIGLSRQSLHDGQRWVHEPLRLTVAIEAPREAIDRIVGRHEVVRQLVEHGWLHLWCIDGSGLWCWQGAGWRPVQAA